MSAGDSPYVRLAIDDAVRSGFVLVLLSNVSLESGMRKEETAYALSLAQQSGSSNVIPVIVEPLDNERVPWELQRIQSFDLTDEPFDQRVEELILHLKTREME